MQYLLAIDISEFYDKNELSLIDQVHPKVIEETETVIEFHEVEFFSKCSSRIGWVWKE